MSEHDAIVFLVSLATLLGLARILGEAARAFGLPTVTGELGAGIVLGKTLLGRYVPGAFALLFPAGPPKTMLDGYTALGIVLILVVAGLEVDLGMVRRRRRTALPVAALGILVPLAAGIGLGWSLPANYLAQPTGRTFFAIFLGVALAISAMPVIAKTLVDLGLFKTDIGLLVMTAAMLDDVVGWLAFSVLLGPMQSALDARSLVRVIALAAAFVVFGLTLVRRFASRLVTRIESSADLAPGRVLSLLIVLAVLGGAATRALGAHAVLGGFVVGIAVGGSPRLRDRTRLVIQQFVTNVFAPVVFAAAALNVDFAAHFDGALTAKLFGVACVAKIGGATLGARLTSLPWRESFAVGFGLNARGAMGVILAFLALEANVIDARLFVGLVTMAVGTSLVAGPMMKRLLYGGRMTTDADTPASLVQAFVPCLAGPTSAKVIEELAVALRPSLGDLLEPALISVLERELVAPTGLGDEVAIPHAAVEGLTRPIVALGLCPEGIDFEAFDGKASRIVFLLLLPPKAYEREVHVLAALARSVFDEEARTALLGTTSLDDAVRCLEAHAQRVTDHPRPRLPSLAGV